MESIRQYDVERLGRDKRDGERDSLVVEEPLEIRVNNESIAVLMRTPGQETELTKGFLLSEGIIPPPGHGVSRYEVTSAVDEMGLPVPNVMNASVPELDIEALLATRRNIFTTSSCGICGRAVLAQVRTQAPPIRGDFCISYSTLVSIPRRLRTGQTNFAATGGLHAAALYTNDGTIASLREDIGRHNAVDKVIGWALSQNDLDFTQLGLIVSGRLSFEMAQKALVAGIPFIAAISAASSMAVDLAKETNLTLVGFLRGTDAVLYCGRQRIAADRS